MPITASCGNCGKTYQAPDRMAGKSVRCKACGEVFRIDSEGGEIDLDALEQSVSGENLATHHASAMSASGVRGPALDEHGRAHIERPDDVEAFSVASAQGPGFRSNYRFRYPGAKLVDQFLPIVLVLLTLVLLTQACLTSEAAPGEGTPTAIGVSRLMILLAAYLFVVWPASHIALRMASTKMRFSMPGAAVWRSFAAFTPVLLMGGWLFVKSGGSGVALVMGLLVGAALAIGAVALLFRIFANEVPTAAGYIAVGSVGSAIFAALAIVAINMIAVSIAGMDKNPSVFVSPIAIGLPWIEKPVVPVTVAVKPTTTKTTRPAAAPTAMSAPPAPTISAPVADAPLGVPTMTSTPTVQALPVPKPGSTGLPLLKSLERTPVAAGIAEVLIPPVDSAALGIVRHASGGTVEVWDRSTWKQPTAQIGQGFERSQGALVIDTTGKKIIRLVRFPTDRLEQVPLGNAPAMSPVTMVDPAVNRMVMGFLNEKEVLIRSGDGDSIAFERYDIAGDQKMALTPLRNTTAGKTEPMDVDITPRTVRVLPDGSGILVAGRDRSVKDSPARLALYSLANLDKAEAFRDIPLKAEFQLRPLGMAVRASGRVALLLDYGGEAALSIWELRNTTIEGAVMKASPKALVDQRYGVLNSLRPYYWDDTIDPLLWVDEETLLLYGTTLIDARSGRRIGTIDVPDVGGQFRVADGSFLLIQGNNFNPILLKATLDPVAVDQARRPRD